MDALRKGEFALRMLREDMIAPISSYSHDLNGPKPVFTLKVNLISGGLILTVAGQHQAMDYPGLGQILHLLSKACHGEPFANEEIASGNLPRYNLIPFLDDSYQPGPELYHRVIDPPTANHTVAAPSHGPRSSWVNTIVGARICQLHPREEATLSRAVDIRRLFDIPESHPGTVINCVYDTATLETFAKESLATTASRLRSQIDHKATKLGPITQAAVTMLHRSSDKSILNYMGTIRTDIDLMFSSFSKVNLHGLSFDFGLGTAEAVRLSLLPADPGIVYVLPKGPDGQLVLAMCLIDTEIDALKKDAEFCKYGKFVE
ncbi:hypothetical protein BDW62DRAFT_199699 [Aspergillus aurantiobrunneus]